MAFTAALRRTLQALGIPAEARHILVAVSGGADSVALLCALHRVAPRLGLQVQVAHLNHGLRGAAADGDARFVRDLARRLDVRCVVRRANVALLARRRRVSVEMAAREARYAFLTQEAHRWLRVVGAPVWVATAHTADDQAETLLLRLARGAGTGGLAGIPDQRLADGVRIVRPLLRVRRAAVERFLNRQHQAWREDASNRDPAMLRNRVRHEVLPLLATRLNPAIGAALCRTADVLRAEDDWMHELVEALLPGALRPSARAGGQSGLLIDVLMAQPLAARRRLILTWLRRAGQGGDAVDFRQVEGVAVLAARERGHKPVALSGGWQVVRRAGALWVERTRTVQKARGIDGDWQDVVRVPGITMLPALGLRIQAVAGVHVQRARPPGVGAMPACATLNWARLGKRALVVRNWRAGDRMAPLGLQGRQKLQDIFVNAKVPRAERACIPIFACGRQVVWIPGYRVAQGWEIRTPRARLLEIRVEAVS